MSSNIKKEKRIRRKARIRAKISGTNDRPRLAVFRSNRYLSVQMIDDVKGVTLASASTLDKELNGYGGNKEAAKKSAPNDFAWIGSIEPISALRLKALIKLRESAGEMA